MYTHCRSRIQVKVILAVVKQLKQLQRNDISLWMKGEEKLVPYLKDYVGIPGDTSHIWTVEF